MSASPPSRYEPIWVKLKREGSVELIITPSLKNRIIKAVRRRHNMDHLYRLNAAETGERTRIRISSAGNKLRFYLERCVYPRDLL